MGLAAFNRMRRLKADAEAKKKPAQLIDSSTGKPPEVTEPVAPKDEKPMSPLDHDGDGRPGGSKKGEESTRAKGARKKGGQK